MNVTFFYQGFESAGIEYISSVLKSAGHRVNLVVDHLLFADGFLNVPSLRRWLKIEERLIQQVEMTEPDLVAFSVVTDYYQWSLYWAAKIKMATRLPIVFGGIHPTSVPERVIAQPCVDMLCIGEGEYPMLELANRFDSTGKINAEGINNFWYKDGLGIAKNEVRSLIDNLDDLPFPDKELFYGAIIGCSKIYKINITRGCPYQCSYCYNNALRKLYSGKGKYLRRRSVDSVIRELSEARERWNFREMVIIDDLFVQDKNWLREFVQRYKKINSRPVPYVATVHPQSVDEEVALLLKDSGCREVDMGVQSADEQIRKNILRRPGSNEDIARAVNLLKSSGIYVYVDHIGGIPYEGEKEQIEAVKFYNRLKPYWASFYWLSYYPHSDIIETAIKAGLFDREGIDKIEEGISLLPELKLKHRGIVPFEILIQLTALLPRPLINFILRHKIYCVFKWTPLFIGQALPRLLASVLRLDNLLIKSFFRRYLNLLKLFSAKTALHSEGKLKK